MSRNSKAGLSPFKHWQKNLKSLRLLRMTTCLPRFSNSYKPHYCEFSSQFFLCGLLPLFEYIFYQLPPEVWDEDVQTVVSVFELHSSAFYFDLNLDNFFCVYAASRKCPLLCLYYYSTPIEIYESIHMFFSS